MAQSWRTCLGWRTVALRSHVVALRRSITRLTMHSHVRMAHLIRLIVHHSVVIVASRLLVSSHMAATRLALIIGYHLVCLLRLQGVGILLVLLLHICVSLTLLLESFLLISCDLLFQVSFPARLKAIEQIFLQARIKEGSPHGFYGSLNDVLVEVFRVVVVINSFVLHTFDCRHFTCVFRVSCLFPCSL